MFRISYLTRITSLITKTAIRTPTVGVKYGPLHIRLYSKIGNNNNNNTIRNKVDKNNKPTNNPSKQSPPVASTSGASTPYRHPPPSTNIKYPYLSEYSRRDVRQISQQQISKQQQQQPECSQNDNNDDQKDKYKPALWIGAFLAAATLAALYGAGVFEKNETVKKSTNNKRKTRCVFKEPKTSQEIPNNVPYLLVGGGTASFAAFRAIKSTDPTARVLVVTNEPFYPYMRPPLSKEIWLNDDRESVKKLIFKQWNGSERNLFYEPEDFYIKCIDFDNVENGGVAVARGWNVKKIDPINKIAYLDDDYEINYKKCLIATGATPKNLSVFEAANADPSINEHIKLYRNIFDFEDIYDSFEQSKTIAIIGGGFLGSELACALARKAQKQKIIYQVFRENGNIANVLPEYLSAWTTNKVKAEGVAIMNNTEITGVRSKNKKIELTLNNGKSLEVDQAIVAVGVEPNTEIAKDSGLEVDPELGGFLVNSELLARTDLYSAGDCACFYDTKLGRRRIEHHDNAVVTGRLAGENMTGKTTPYLHQSMFWSDLGPDVGFEAIGIVDSKLPTVGVFAKTDKDSSTTSSDDNKKPSELQKSHPHDGDDFNKGVIFYLRDDIVVGIILWNVFNRMPIARQVLKNQSKYDDLNEVAKLFNIHED